MAMNIVLPCTLLSLPHSYYSCLEPPPSVIDSWARGIAPLSTLEDISTHHEEEEAEKTATEDMVSHVCAFKSYLTLIIVLCMYM